jgi:hypothetical protein
VTTWRIVETVGGVNLIETPPAGKDVITRRFRTEVHAKVWLLDHLSMADLAELERWLRKSDKQRR